MIWGKSERALREVGFFVLYFDQQTGALHQTQIAGRNHLFLPFNLTIAVRPDSLWSIGFAVEWAGSRKLDRNKKNKIKEPAIIKNN